jgi:hypothetical protein
MVKLQKNGRGRHLVNQTKPRAAVKTETEVSADVVQFALRQRFNPIRNLTPQLLATYIDQFFIGFIAYAALAWEWIERRDDVLKNVASKRKKDAARLEWEILTVDGADDKESKAHAEALDEFYENLTVVNALDENERGGFPLLIRQMMDAVGKTYAVHEIVWKPSEGHTGSVLTAELRFVPLWFFENRTGRLRFLEVPLGGSEGKALEDGGWMITKGDGLMEACSIAYMFKNMPLKDWVAYSDKFGTPGVLGQTNASKESDAGKSMASAVRDFGQNWGGVVYGADGAIKEPIQLVQAKGEGLLPFPPLVERMDRAMTALWRGADLSSMSGSKQHNVGSSVQESESSILLYDDAAMLSETLNYYIDRWIIWQKFGVTQPLAFIKVLAPDDEDIELDIKVDEFLLNSGARLGEKERLAYYGRPIASASDTPLHAPAKVAERITPQVTGSEQKPIETLPNQRDVDLETLLGRHRDQYLAAFANDLHPLRVAIQTALEDADQSGNGELDPKTRRRLRAQLPGILKQINESDRSSESLVNIVTEALKRPNK